MPRGRRVPVADEPLVRRDRAHRRVSPTCTPPPEATAAMSRVTGASVAVALAAARELHRADGVVLTTVAAEEPAHGRDRIYTARARTTADRPRRHRSRRHRCGRRGPNPHRATMWFARIGGADRHHGGRLHGRPVLLRPAHRLDVGRQRARLFHRPVPAHRRARTRTTFAYRLLAPWLLHRDRANAVHSVTASVPAQLRRRVPRLREPDRASPSRWIGIQQQRHDVPRVASTRIGGHSAVH